MEKQGVPELHGHEPFTLLLLSCQLVQPRVPACYLRPVVKSTSYRQLWLVTQPSCLADRIDGGFEGRIYNVDAVLSQLDPGWKEQ